MALLRAGTKYFYEQDGVSSVTSLSNSTGALSNTYRYDGFGKALAASETVANYLRYTAREKDSTGFFYYRARYYGWGEGRFSSEDPLSSTSKLQRDQFLRLCNEQAPVIQRP